jgi:hypothetical protein
VGTRARGLSGRCEVCGSRVGKMLCWVHVIVDVDVDVDVVVVVVV